MLLNKFMATTHASLAQASRLRLVINGTSETLAPATACYKIIFSILILFYIGLDNSYGQINSSSYHIVRNDLQNSFLKFNQNKKGRVAFLGGSITYNPGWRDSISSYIARRFPETQFEFIAAGIPSMGSTPGAFRLERDILDKGKIDLLFVEAAVNDPTNGRSPTEQIRGMEGIIRHARSANPKIDIVAMYFVDPDKMKDYNGGRIPEVIQNHEKVASHYEVSGINLAKEVTDRINAGEFRWEEDFKNLHPSPFGQLIYYNSMKLFLEGVWETNPVYNTKTTRHPLPEQLDPFSYDKGKLVSIEKAKLSSGWYIDPFWKPSKKSGTRAGYVNVPMLISTQPSSELSLQFKGKAIGIAVV
jgi:sialidase-1